MNRPYMKHTKKFTIRVARTGGKTLQGSQPLINRISEAELRARRVQHLRDSQPGRFQKHLVPLQPRSMAQFAAVSVNPVMLPHPPSREPTQRPSEWLQNSQRREIFSSKLTLPFESSWRQVYKHRWRNKVQCKVVSGVACTPGRIPYSYTHNVHPLS